MNNIVEQYLKALEHGVPSMELTMAYRKYKCGGKTKKKENGGDIEEAKCGCKTKKKKVTKAEGGTKTELPTAPSAKEAYKNGTIQSRPDKFSFGWEPYDNILAWRSPEIITAQPPQSTFFNYFPRSIRKEIRYHRNNPDHILDVDTLYYEHPEYRNRFGHLTKLKYRIGASSDKDRSEYEILKRRFNEAKSVSKPIK